MKGWMAALVVLLMVAGCASEKPPSSHAPVGAADPRPSPRVVAVVASGPGGEQRFTPQSMNLALTVSGPVTLRAEVADVGPAVTMEWFFRGIWAQGWGEVAPGERELRPLGAGPTVQVDLGPGTRGDIWIRIRGEGPPESRPEWESWAIYPRIPLPVTSTCPPIRLPPPPENPGHAWRDMAVDKTGNTVTLNWAGRTFLLPLSADPATCADHYVAANLRVAKELP